MTGLDLTQLTGKTLLVTGGTGMIGKWMIDSLLSEVDCRVIVAGRAEGKVRERFTAHMNGGRAVCPHTAALIPASRLFFLQWDPSHPVPLTGAAPVVGLSKSSDTLPLSAFSVDYIIHLASNTHPVAYASDPVSTIVMNVNATKELLDLAVAKKTRRFVYASSVEIYGQNRGDAEKFDEDYCGYINSNTLRAGYPESKRCGEALCQAYIKQYGLDIVIPRIARVYGPTLLKTDTKALSQFLRNAIEGQDIVLKSEGKQYFSYLHVADAVSGLLTVMLKGEKGVAYNLADEKSDITLRDLATLIARKAGVKVVFELPNAVESAGFSPAMRAILDGSKLSALGWTARYDIERGIGETIRQMKE